MILELGVKTNPPLQAKIDLLKQLNNGLSQKSLQIDSYSGSVRDAIESLNKISDTDIFLCLDGSRYPEII